mmetsp:Transcript_6863/g.6013  ORF Transcript_6863/g.6013 Transcript_6863/m.6013 type:complete len:161 (+) Transcript_6863:10-492(+)
MFWSCELKEDQAYTIPDNKNARDEEDGGILIVSGIRLISFQKNEKYRIIAQEYDTEFVIASLNEKLLSHKLKLQFEQGNRASFRVEGKGGSILLTGYWQRSPGEFEFDPHNCLATQVSNSSKLLQKTEDSDEVEEFEDEEMNSESSEDKPNPLAALLKRK